MHSLYRVAAVQGWLGEEALNKYEQQTKGGTGVMALLLGGRMESFCGLVACVDNPIVGFGPWASDENGYTAKYLIDYGTHEDFEDYVKSRELALAYGKTSHMIPAHAYITEFWLWYGVFGLLFWIYVIFVLIRYLKQDCWVVPQWFMWLAASIPGYFWSIFFSPWADRIGGVVFVVACLISRAVRIGAQEMPNDMKEEILKKELK